MKITRGQLRRLIKESIGHQFISLNQGFYNKIYRMIVNVPGSTKQMLDLLETIVDEYGDEDHLKALTNIMSGLTNKLGQLPAGHTDKDAMLSDMFNVMEAFRNASGGREIYDPEGTMTQQDHEEAARERDRIMKERQWNKANPRDPMTGGYYKTRLGRVRKLNPFEKGISPEESERRKLQNANIDRELYGHAFPIDGGEE